MKQPKPKLVEIRIEENGQRIANFDGTIHANERGNIFVGIDADAQVAKIQFPDWHLRKPQRPNRAAADNTTRILQNHIAMEKNGVSWSLAPGYWPQPISDRTIYRSKQDAKPYIRHVATTVIDGRILAIAFMKDNKPRAKGDNSGPAWVLFDGDKKARFVADVQIVKNDK